MRGFVQRWGSVGRSVGIALFAEMTRTRLLLLSLSDLAVADLSDELSKSFSRLPRRVAKSVAVFSYCTLF